MRRAAVVGAGITGLLTGWALQRAGWQVVVLEARHVGAGSSSRTAAGIRQQFSTPATIRGMRHAVAEYLRYGEAWGARCLVPQGYLFLAGDDAAYADARDRVALQHEHGLDEVELLDADALATRFPWVDGVVGGTWCPTDGFLRPEVVLDEAAKALVAAGGTIRTRAPVRGARHGAGGIVALELDDGPLAVDLVVDATNAWTHRLTDRLGASDLPVVPARRHLWFLARSDEVAPADLASRPMVISPAGVYARPENADRLLMGWAKGDVVGPDFDDDAQDAIPAMYAHDGGIDAVPFEAWAAFAEVVPDVGTFDGLVATTSGLYAVTPDHNPFLGFDPAVPNLLRLVGFSGHGAMFGPFTAAAAVAMAEAGRDVDVLSLPTGDVALDAFAVGRPIGDAETLVI